AGSLLVAVGGAGPGPTAVAGYGVPGGSIASKRYAALLASRVGEKEVPSDGEDIPIGAGCRSWAVGSVIDPGRGGRTHDRTSTTRGDDGNAADGCTDPTPGRCAGGGPGVCGARHGDHRSGPEFRCPRRGDRRGACTWGRPGR